MPESPHGGVSFQSTRNSKSPYAFSVVRCTPWPFETSSPVAASTLQFLSRSAFHSVFFASRSSGVNFASTYGLNTPPPPGRPRQPVRSLPLNSVVKPFFAAGAFACALTTATAPAPAPASATATITTEIDRNRIVYELLRGLVCHIWMDWTGFTSFYTYLIVEGDLFTGTSPLLHRRVVADPQHLVDQGGDLKLDAHVHTVYSGRTS